MESPKNLSHKPIISVNDYDKIDAQYRTNTDVRALSIGTAQYDKNEISLVGTTLQQNKEDTMKENLELYPFIKQRNIKTLIPPIIRVRLSETLEKQRLKLENS